jgi:leucyl/phenylalanyl-tRNA---protein transferase
MKVIFPPVDNANADGLLAIGGELNWEILDSSYRQGVFPWPIQEDYPMTWFAPARRGIIDLLDFRIPRSLNKFLKKNPYTIQFNQNFESIINHCAEVKRKDHGTWIYPSIIESYTELFHRELAYCVGVYENQELVGGVYGVCIGEIISGESMFHLRTNASKVALVALLLKLKEKKIPFLDTQMVTEVVASLGGKTVARSEFMKRLAGLETSRLRSEIFD